MVFGLFKKKEPVKVTIKGTGETFMCQPDQLLMKAAFAADDSFIVFKQGDISSRTSI